jgi:hypothetical protein
MREGPSNVSTAGPVVLDIGGAIGAAVVIGPARFEGLELEIRAAHGAWDGTHAMFHSRDTECGAVVAAVFPQLVEGNWELRLRDDPDGPTATVKVLGGRASQVAFLD